ncbi:enhancer of split mgamma protein-like [Mercenaria mercenaria]|uniref:enhancer of split mgamma protein-like n=1 Tax=Mercenaria mercenaria TaxID=6596 RepID=UPI00234EE080|nr:enhancer of split mgamma protein-like [Mercenaria mercenaria]
MVGTKYTQIEDTSYIRKIWKPMVEKKRRERMNQSISQLKSLIAQTIQQNTAPMTRVDKADILELTVYHLTQLQQQQRSVTMATEAAAFSAGYKACAREAVTYMASNQMASSTVTGSLNSHLHSSFLMNSRRQQSATRLQNNPKGSNSQIKTERLSTPLRHCDSFNTSLPELNLSGYSPIVNNTQSLPELTSSFVHAGLNSSSSSEYFSTDSSVSISSSDSCLSHSDNSTGDDYRAENEAKDLECIDVVSVGNGKENEIGHVIKDVLWRPF